MSATRDDIYMLREDDAVSRSHQARMLSPLWTPQEDDVLREEYRAGLDWEERAAARLPHRTVNGVLWRASRVHLRSSRYLRWKGLTPADCPCPDDREDGVRDA